MTEKLKEEIIEIPLDYKYGKGFKKTAYIKLSPEFKFLSSKKKQEVLRHFFKQAELSSSLPK